MPRLSWLVLFVLMALGACARPPASAYESVAQGGHPATVAIILGRNSAGEACTAQKDATGAAVYCGNWDQPSAIISKGGPGSAVSLGANLGTNLGTLARSSPWRARLEARYACGAPRPGTILGRYPAELLSCTQRIGGWPHVAMISLIRGQVYQADGIAPALPVMQRALGVVSGAVPARDAKSVSVTASDQLLASRLAAEAFSSGDIGHFDALMTLGGNANQAEDFTAAATAYRAALALQQKALGAANPGTFAPMADLALQLSDQGHYQQADALFSRAQFLAADAADPNAMPRLLHYRALDQLNQGDDRRALTLLRRAERGYAALVPPAMLRPRPASTANPVLADLADSGAGAFTIDPGTLAGPVIRQALLGVIETLRYQAVALNRLGQPEAGDAVIRRARAIADANGIASPILNARLDRTGAAFAKLGQPALAANQLATAQINFEQALPGSLPVAETELLRAAALAQQGLSEQALAMCQQGVQLLVQLRLGTSSRLIAPCLNAEYQAAQADPGSAQAHYGKMFRMAELAQGSVTSQEIAEASARLAANARDPKVAAAIRARQDAAAALAQAYRQRDEVQQNQDADARALEAALAASNRRIVAANEQLQQADLAVQAAAPNYGSLIQQVVPPQAVLALLHPREAYLGITLTPHHAWLFLLRDRKIQVARTGIGEPAMTRLVRRVRASIEPTETGLPRFDMTDAAAIYQATLAPFGPALGSTSSLIIAPSGPLLSLPFALLPAGPADANNLADAPWLVRRETLTYVPAAANFVGLRKIAGDSRAAKPWFGFGDFRNVTPAQAQATFNGPACGESAALFASLPGLPYAKLELAAAAGIFGAGPGDELTGTAFTVPAVEAADLANFRILHFATHALLPTDLPCATAPAIVTSAPAGARSADQAMLTTSDVSNLHLDADLVLLSACNTGGADGEAGGEALSGLARSFFYAGARALMVTQWAVNDQVSAYLVASTLQRLKSAADGGAAGSLRAAQLAMINGAGHGLPATIANPFYWAAFVVIGDGGQTRIGQTRNGS